MSLYRRHPADPRAWFSEEQIARAASYRRPLRRVALAESALGIAGLAALVAGRGAPRLVEALGIGSWPLQSLVIASGLVLAGFALGWPAGLWRLAYERRWKLSHQRLGGWAADQATGLVLTLALANAAALGLWGLVRRAPVWWLLAWAGTVAAMALLAMIAPAVLAPLFNRFRPLEDTWLTERAVELGRRLGVRIRQVLVMDASRRTAKHNAYFTGLGRTKRVVIWDTLLADYDRPATLAVLAHELAHWRHRHGHRLLALTAAAMLPGFLALDRLLRSARVEAWAGIRGPGDPAALPLVVLAAAVMQALWLPATLWLSRAWERQADLDAVSLTGDAQTFRSMQHDLAVRNLSDLAPSRLAYALASHPPAAERMALVSAEVTRK